MQLASMGVEIGYRALNVLDREQDSETGIKDEAPWKSGIQRRNQVLAWQI